MKNRIQSCHEPTIAKSPDLSIAKFYALVVAAASAGAGRS